MQSCDTVAKRPNTCTHLMLPCYTERQPSHNLNTQGTTPLDIVARNSSVHAHIHLCTVRQSEAKKL